MAILVQDRSVGINAYMKIISLSFREVGFFTELVADPETGEQIEKPTNIKKYTAIAEVECYNYANMVGIYNTKIFPIINLVEKDCNLINVYEKIMSLPEMEGSVFI